VAKLVNTGGAGLSGSWRRVTEHSRPGGAPGCVLHGVLSVRNPGTQTAATSLLRLFLSVDETLDDGDQLVKETLLGPLPAGRTRTQRLRAQLEGSASGQFLIAVLDAADTIPEADERNNVVVSPAISQERSNARS
jgi:hypothetical protein